MCAFVLGERLTPIRFMVAVMGFGILVVARPDFSDNPAIIAAALCAVGLLGQP